MLWGLWSVYDLKRRRCGLEMSIGLTRLDTSKAFHGAASSASRTFRSHTHASPFLKFHSALSIFSTRDFFLFACRVIFKPDFKRHFSVLQSSKRSLPSSKPPKQVSKQSQRTLQSTLFVSPVCLSYLELALSPLHSPQTCFFFCFVFVFEVGGKYGIESRGRKREEEEEEEGWPTKQK